MTCIVPSLKLNNGHTIPQLAFGTFDAAPGEVKEAVEAALTAGFRHIDGAAFYCNEEEVGEGIAAAMKKHNIKREEIFVTTKLWCDKHAPKDVMEACKLSLNKLGLKYLDLYLIHFPAAFHLPEGATIEAFKPNSVINEDVKIEDTWKAMESLVHDGLVKSIGISNFNKRQIERILAICSIPPAVNQVEVNLSWLNTKLIDFCHSNNIHIEAYSPLGSPGFFKDKAPSLMENNFVVEVAKKYNKQPAQVLLRHAIQRGLVVIVKSVTPERIKSNFNVFNFALTKAEMEKLNTLGLNKRTATFLFCANHPEYPFNDEC